MRFNEEQVQPEKGKKKEEAPREMAKPGSYTMEELSAAKDRPFLGGNSFGGS